MTERKKRRATTPAAKEGVALVGVVVELVEAWVREGRPDGAVDEAARFARQYWRKVREAVRADPEHRVDVVTLARLAAVAGRRVGLLSGHPDPLAAALADAVAALQRAEEAAVAAGDERAAMLVRPALGVVGRLAAEKGGTPCPRLSTSSS